MSAVALESFRVARLPRRRALGLAVVWAAVLANAGAIVWLWAHGGNLTDKTTGDLLTSTRGCRSSSGSPASTA